MWCVLVQIMLVTLAKLARLTMIALLRDPAAHLYATCFAFFGSP